LPVLEAGQRHFGENYVKEAGEKWPSLLQTYPEAILHLIGPLQSNKSAVAVALFQVIHTLDRPSLAQALRREIDRQGKKPLLLIQVNTGSEPQKGGVLPEGADAFIDYCRHDLSLEISGLMAIPPFDDPPSPHFGFLQKLARKHGLPHLSMGMSSDFDAAIQLGATYVRVGSAIFGAR
jgi:pyridoxal phosphate enzyme (YggS family)